MRRRNWATVWLFAALSTLPRSALAEPSVADSAIERGVQLRRNHRDAEALVEFRRAYAHERSPRALAQIALAEASLARWVDAEQDLIRAMSSDSPWVLQEKGVLQQALDEINDHLGTLELHGPDGAEVWIDDVFVTRLPRPLLRVSAERLTIELRAPGFLTERRTVDVGPRSVVAVPFALAPIVHAEEAPMQPTDAARVRPISSDRRNPTGFGPAPWVAAGTAVGLLGVGVAFTMYGSAQAAHYNSAQCVSPNEPRSVFCAATASHIVIAEVGEVVGYGLAAAAGVTSAILFLTVETKHAHGASLKLQPTLFGGVATYTF